MAKGLGLKKSILECSTPWNSTFDMLQRLLDYKTCADVIDSKLNMNSKIWESIADFVEILEPVKKVTLKLQIERINLGDFYGLW